MTLRRVSIGSAYQVFEQPTTPTDRVGATCAKLMERRSSLQQQQQSQRRVGGRCRPRRSRSMPSVEIGCGAAAATPAAMMTAGRIRRCSDTALLSTERRPQPSRRGVTFSAPLVTSVSTRPYTTVEEKPALFYSRAEIAIFKARRHIRERDVYFADETVTEVWEPTCAPDETADAMRDQLYYSADELQGFLKEFLATLGDEEANIEEEKDDCDNNDDSRVEVTTDEQTTDGGESDLFEDIPLDDIYGGCSNPAEDDDTDSDTESDSSSDDDYYFSGEEEERRRSAAVQVWPAAAVVAPLPSPECRRGAGVVVDGIYAANHKSLPLTAAAAC